MLTPYNITLHVYAESPEEAIALQNALRDFVVEKYNQGIYPRAASLNSLLQRFGNSMMVNALIK